MELTSKLLVDAEIVQLCTGENVALKPLTERIPGNSLTILDRGFQSKSNFHRLQSPEENRHFLCRVRSTFKPKWIKTLSPCSWLGEVVFTATERSKDPRLPESLTVRIIEYKVT